MSDFPKIAILPECWKALVIAFTHVLTRARAIALVKQKGLFRHQQYEDYFIS